MITQADLSDDAISQVEDKAKKWLSDFVGLSKCLDGHQKNRVTPYMHILVYHVPAMMKKFGSIRYFSGQG